MEDCDVLIVGAGPAGACLAANLASLYRVLLIDRVRVPAAVSGETLAPAARRLFADMGLEEAFRAEGHASWHANLGNWGDDRISERALVGDLDGHGWLLERRRFDLWLRDIARYRGAFLLAPASVHGLWRHDGAWRAAIAAEAGPTAVTARIVVDATGRRGAVARRLGIHRELFDRLVCRWIVLGTPERTIGSGTTFVQAAEEGWWYSAPVKSGRLFAFHTDADLPTARQRRSNSALLSAARQAGLLARFQMHETAAVAASGIRAAHGSRLGVAAGSDWIAVGDAALSFDPLGARGLLTALVSGLAGAEACNRRLAGTMAAFDEHRALVADLSETYGRQRAEAYAVETRWPDAVFWRRRRTMEATRASSEHRPLDTPRRTFEERLERTS